MKKIQFKFAFNKNETLFEGVGSVDLNLEKRDIESIKILKMFYSGSIKQLRQLLIQLKHQIAKDVRAVLNSRYVMLSTDEFCNEFIKRMYKK